MNFDFSEEQYLLRDSVESYLAENWGSQQRRATSGKFSDALWQGLTGLGLQTLLVPEQYGGSGLGMVDAVLPFEALGRYLVPTLLAETILASEIIARFGSVSQRQQYLPGIAAGTIRIAFAHAENAPVTADGDALTGRKILVAAAESATHLAVSARLPDGGRGLFIVATPNAQRHIAVDPDNLSCRVDFAATPADPLGSEALARLLDTSAAAAATQMIGVAGAALDIAVAYAKQRTQFGALIGSFQAIKHKCADILVAVEHAKSVVYYAAWALAEGDPGAALAVSMAKAAAGDACRLACNDGLQMHGGVGFTAAFDIHHFLKRGKLLEYSYGDANWHRERVAARILA